MFKTPKARAATVLNRWDSSAKLSLYYIKIGCNIDR
jgi:hypothetical protein